MSTGPSNVSGDVWPRVRHAEGCPSSVDSGGGMVACPSGTILDNVVARPPDASCG